MGLISNLAFSISVIGVAVIAWGVVQGAREFIVIEISRFRGGDIVGAVKTSRRRLSSYLLLGLEFMVSADIMKTVINPSLHEVAILGAIVAIRTVLSYFLNLEMKNTGPA